MHGKHIPILIFITAFVLVLECSSMTLAGTLTIETKATVMTKGDLLKGSIRVLNKGNVAAHNIQADVIVLGEQIKSPVKKLLAIDESHRFEFEKMLKGIKKGRYPLQVIVDFHDANQYPFSAVSCTTFFLQKDTNPDLFCLIDNLTMNRKGKLPIDLKNRGPSLKDIHVTLVLPRELYSPRPRVDFDMESRSQKIVEFTIENVYALSGASYPIFCVFEYDVRDTHYTALSGAVVTIEKSKNWFWRFRWFWMAIAGVFGAAFIVYQLKKNVSIRL